MKFKDVMRLSKICYVFAKHGLDELFFVTPWLKPIKPLLYLNPRHWFGFKEENLAGRISACLEELGPLFVKFGQLLSTRQDVFDAEMIEALSQLQDHVAPFAASKVQKVLEKTYKKPIYQVFKDFDLSPVASASIAQVHFAKLLDGSEVAVKILRPDIAKHIDRDIRLLYAIARRMERYLKISKRLKPIEVVQEIESTLLAEIDLMQEAANASELRRNFEHTHILKVPKVYWDQTKKNILVQERISGVPISDIKTLHSHQVDMQLLAERGVEIFFTQVFRDNFFHADMHPGNIFVDISKPKDPRYIAVDFGIMGILDTDDKDYLLENLMAFFQRDYMKVAHLHIESGWVDPTTRIDALSGAIRAVCEPVFEKPISEISLSQTMMRLFSIAEKFDMKVQPQLLLLQKTMFNVEGLGRHLYPELNLWQTALPHLKKWAKDQIGVKHIFQAIKNEGPGWLKQLPEIPNLVYQSLQQNAKRPQALVPVAEPDKGIGNKRSWSLSAVLLSVLGFVVLSIAAVSLDYKDLLSQVVLWLQTHTLIAVLIAGVLFFWAWLRSRAF